MADPVNNNVSHGQCFCSIQSVIVIIIVSICDKNIYNKGQKGSSRSAPLPVQRATYTMFDVAVACGEPCSIIITRGCLWVSRPVAKIIIRRQNRARPCAHICFGKQSSQGGRTRLEAPPHSPACAPSYYYFLTISVELITTFLWANTKKNNFAAQGLAAQSFAAATLARRPFGDLKRGP